MPDLPPEQLGGPGMDASNAGRAQQLMMQQKIRDILMQRMMQQRMAGQVPPGPGPMYPAPVMPMPQTGLPGSGIGYGQRPPPMLGSPR